MSIYGKDRICRSSSELKEALLALSAIPEKFLPVRISVKRERKKRGEDKNRLLNAHLRDIARHHYGGMTVPERVMDNVVDDFKRSEIWPKYSDPEPDYNTGEVLYRPKSRADLTDQEVRGIVDWLAIYMMERHILSYGPTDQGEPT